MEAVWDLGEATVQQVRDRLRRGAAAGLYDGPLGDAEAGEGRLAVAHRAEGRSYLYRPVRSREEAGATSLRTFVERVFRGDPLLLFQHLLEDEDLSDEDLRALKTMIDRRRKDKDKERHNG